VAEKNGLPAAGTAALTASTTFWPEPEDAAIFELIQTIARNRVAAIPAKAETGKELVRADQKQQRSQAPFITINAEHSGNAARVRVSAT